jgi:hypothetical protein
MTPEWALPLRQAFITFFNYLFQAFTAFQQYDSPLFWPFLVSALVIGAIAPSGGIPRRAPITSTIS